jgi:hypothetical protein
MRYGKLSNILVEMALADLPRGKTKRGKDIVFFDSLSHLKKELKQFIPSNSTIKTKKTSFSGFGYGSSINFTFGIDGRDMPSMGSPETFAPFVGILNGLKEFRSILSGREGGEISIGIGDETGYDIVTGI